MPKSLRCAANYSQILAADEAGLDAVESTLKSCRDDSTTKCKVDKALQHFGLEKSTATAEPPKVSILMYILFIGIHTFYLHVRLHDRLFIAYISGFDLSWNQIESCLGKDAKIDFLI